MLYISVFTLVTYANALKLPGQVTGVSFHTNDSLLQEIYDRAEIIALGNIQYFGDRRVMIEGAQYRNVWLETQPMGGYMYAKRNPEIALNNIGIFVEHQREDGRLPGVIYRRNGTIEPNYCQFQGFCFPMPAYETYFLLGKDRLFLEKIYNSLEKFDSYLWKNRDSDNNGCLESWCIYDTGEDHGIRFNEFPNAWSFEFPPSKEAALRLSPEELRLHCKETFYDSLVPMTVPIESMDIMSYSYSCRAVLSMISAELDASKIKYWSEAAMDVRRKIRDYLWIEDRSACFDRDADNKTMPVLLHNNLRCMYFGSFDQDMADMFVRDHLMNQEEFWTPMPLPSVAANDQAFRNTEGNNWNGQPQGLTYQRSIRALENYGHFAELTLIGMKFLEALSRSKCFTQQFDPFAQTVYNTNDGYGPSALSALEFVSRLYGIHISRDEIHWSCLESVFEYRYTQIWNSTEYSLHTEGDRAVCSVNGIEIFSFARGARVVTCPEGKPKRIIGITPGSVTFSLDIIPGQVIHLEPNTIYNITANCLFEKMPAPAFYAPFAY